MQQVYDTLLQFGVEIWSTDPLRVIGSARRSTSWAWTTGRGMSIEKVA